MGEEEEKGEKEVQLEAQEPEAGERKPAKMNDPKEPTEEEKRIHDLTRLPYRSWCKHCVRGRGTNAPHKRQEDRGNRDGGFDNFNRGGGGGRYEFTQAYFLDVFQ